jgi:hypothetical protein
MVNSISFLHHKLDNTTSNNNNTGSTSVMQYNPMVLQRSGSDWPNPDSFTTDHNQSSDSVMKPGDSCMGEVIRQIREE